MPSDPLSVVLVGGLHADARRTAVDRLLHTVPGSVALHHDLTAAAAGTVRRTVRDRTGTLDEGETPLVDDCACCALREDLVPELERLAAGGGCRLAVVELWDSVEPKAMAEVVAAHGGERVRLTGVVTAVDPALVLPALGCGDDLAEAGLQAAATDRRTVADTFARQLEYASVLALVADTAVAPPGDPSGGATAFGAPVEPADAVDLALLDQLVPTARRIPADSVDLAAAAVAGFDVAAAADRQHPACALLPQEADADGVTTLVWKRRRPFHPGRLYAALEDLTCAAARSRGRFWLADRPDTLLAWDAAGGALCVEGAGPWLAALPDAAWELVPASRRVAAALDWHPEHGDRTQHLTFTSPGLDRDGLCALLESCLLTDAEYAAGPAAWRLLSPAFDALLDPVS
ncbi:cobalamin biosynthesis protein CobW [Streptomyces eurocidicus]|uniref:Cobalamin biosynthesis protein CobW n=1 Tax=Streptomyces eurocidicus TaxID=66423 RepID=A0A2N8NXC7_STREU|nr:GTP-binding protein [Streptomyces eurocidicus]MBB5120439.1 G3E family GTPase [Streptomyces eurocidicus]MBF6053652.1 cobalamin biosynthesis protein CobW [Streptomyces eurocidicus]PNE33409.1 cobalamin biosynthesis protein CobW [Streptomyces eurocidicus]